MQHFFVLRLYGILFCVDVELCLECFAAVLQIVEVLMRFKRGQLCFDDRNGDIGAMVGDTLEVVQNIVEDEARFDGTLTALQTENVTGERIRPAVLLLCD